MTPKKHHPQYDAIERHIRSAGLERSVALGEAIAGMLGMVVNAMRRTRPAGRQEVIAIGQFERLGNSHREMLESIRASARRDFLTATGSWVRRTGAQR